MSRGHSTQSEELAGLEQEHLATLRYRRIQACVEIDTDRAAAVVPISTR
jgi:hypothetical protein